MSRGPFGAYSSNSTERNTSWCLQCNGTNIWCSPSPQESTWYQHMNWAGIPGLIYIISLIGSSHIRILYGIVYRMKNLVEEVGTAIGVEQITHRNCLLLIALSVVVLNDALNDYKQKVDRFGHVLLVDHATTPWAALFYNQYQAQYQIRYWRFLHISQSIGSTPTCNCETP